ncbi:MAG TPA: hypothetical protein VJB70_03210 [Candidatus Paceibacterota bacterium]
MQRKIQIIMTKKNAGGIALFFFFLFLFWKSDAGMMAVGQEASLLRSELSSFIVPDISFGNIYYTVNGGHVFYKDKAISGVIEKLILKTAYASVHNRLDPIFAIEGTDPDALIKSLKKLEASRLHIANLYQSEENFPQKALYPIEFLHFLAKTEKARQIVINQPSNVAIWTYYQSLYKTIVEYIEYIKILQEVLHDIENQTENITFNFIGGTTTPSLYIEALEGILTTAEEKKVIVKKRMACFKVFSPNCSVLPESFHKLVLVSPEEFNGFSKLEKIPETITENEEVLNLYTKATKQISNEKKYPIVSIPKSKCLSNEPTYYALQEELLQNGQKVFRLNFLNDIYFYDTEKHSANYLKELRLRGVSFLFQPITNLYMCPEISRDLSGTVTASTIYDTLTKRNLLFDIDLRILTDTVTTQRVLQEAEIGESMYSIATLLNNNGEQVLKERFGAEHVFFAERLLSLFKQRSPYFDSMVNMVVSHNDIVEALFRTKTDSTPHTIFLSRNYPALLLLTHNESFMGHSPKFMSLKTSNFTDFKLVSYNKDLKHVYNQKQILEIMLHGREVQKRINE